MGLPEPKRVLTLPRGLIVLSCLWIALSWLILFGVDPPVQAVTTSYSDAVGMMTMSTILGISLGWPLLRTSGRQFTLPLRQAILDMIVLACAVQVVTWPLRLVSTWSIMETLLISGLLCAWIIPFGAIVRFGAASARPLVRTCAMAIAVLIVVGGGLLADGAGSPWWSPLDSVLLLTRSHGDIPTPGSATGIVATSIAGVGLWIVLAGARMVMEPCSDEDSNRVDSA